MESTQLQPQHKARLTWVDKFGTCCHRRENSVESIYHPERVVQALADLGPPTRSSLHLSPVEGDNDIDMDKLVPTSVRKSISYPDFRADSIVLSDAASLRSSPGRGRSEFLQRTYW